MIMYEAKNKLAYNWHTNFCITMFSGIYIENATMGGGL
jgi:hypothetical protein